MKILLLLLGVIPPSFCFPGLDERYSESEPIQLQLDEPQVGAYYADYMGCGGVIPISSFTWSRILYKKGVLFDPYESCVWTLAPREGVTNVQVVVYQNMTNSWDGITVYFANATGLTHFKLPSNYTDFYFNTPLAFLVFSSDASHESNGFEIEIVPLGNPGTRSVGAYHVRKDEGKFSYPNEDGMKNPDKTAAVVLERKASGLVSSLLQVKLKDVTVDENNWIQVYALNSHHWSVDYGLLGRFTTDAEIVVSTMNPVLILLESRTNLTGQGFQVEWKPYPHSIQ